MAARLKTRHQADIRLKIQADRIIALLQAGIFGTKFQRKAVTLTSEKVAAARLLLNKCLPDLVRTELTGADGKPVELRTIDDVEVARRVAFILARGDKAAKATNSAQERK